MARTRTIDREAVLEAAVRVVARDGATHLTLDAVAAEAGISKASVLYDYKTKQALVKAVITHRVNQEMDRLRGFIDQQGDGTNATILGLIGAAAGRTMSETDRNIALELSAALSQHEDLRDSIQSAYRELFDGLARTSENPRQAMLTFLALEGLKLMECFGFYVWPADERQQLMADIRALLQSQVPLPAVHA
jgi:AcrR family transcriptional regulator